MIKCYLLLSYDSSIVILVAPIDILIGLFHNTMWPLLIRFNNSFTAPAKMLKSIYKVFNRQQMFVKICRFVDYLVFNKDPKVNRKNSIY